MQLLSMQDAIGYLHLWMNSLSLTPLLWSEYWTVIIWTNCCNIGIFTITDIIIKGVWYLYVEKWGYTSYFYIYICYLNGLNQNDITFLLISYTLFDKKKKCFNLWILLDQRMMHFIILLLNVLILAYTLLPRSFF